jgi:hypothetical protein
VGHAGNFAQVLSVVFLSSLAVAPVNMALLVVGRQHEQFAWEIARLLLVIVGWVAIIQMALPPVNAVMIHASILVLMNGAFLWLADCALRAGPPPAAAPIGESKL